MPDQILPAAVRRLRALLDDPVRKFQLALFVLFLLVVAGTMGYRYFVGMGFVDALYMTVITVTTVGFGEIHPLGEDGRMFTIALIVLGVGTAAWAISSGVEVLLGQNLWYSVQRRKMQDLLTTISDHYIVCGYGRMGRQIVRDLRARDEKFVVIDMLAEREESMIEDQIPYIIGDATEDDTLARARVTHARGVVTALGDDAGNVLTVLTARGLNPDILIVARSSAELAENKLLRAGADRVVSPYSIGGHRLALALLQPAAHDFMTQIFNLEDLAVDIGEINVVGSSPLVGQTIADSDVKRIWNLIILAVKEEGDDSGTEQEEREKFTISPDPQHVIRSGETLIVIGSAKSIYELQAQRRDRKKRGKR
jgi:voltage-gated potassium channel